MLGKVQRRDASSVLQPWARGHPPATLPPFSPARPALRRAALKLIFLVFCAFLGVFYGLAFAVFPPSLLIYLGFPILIALLVVIWALPDQGHPPSRLLTQLFLAYAVVWVMWPNYLALQLPGLPWISMRRIFGFPLALVFLICMSISPRFREELRRALAGIPLLWKLVMAFLFVQWVTIAMSADPFRSLNIVVNHTILNVTTFFVAAWVFHHAGRAEAWTRMIIGTVIVLSVIAGIEFQQQKVLWADYIPSFLAVTDESVQRTLSGQVRDGAYRVVTTFTVPLSMAEYLALVTPFVLQKLLNKSGMIWRLFYVSVDGLILAAAIWTGARLGIVGWIVAHVAVGCLWSYQRWRTNKSDMLGPALALGIPALALAFSVAMFTVPAVKYRTIGGGSTTLSDQGRQEQFDRLGPIVLRNPVGHGAGNSGAVLQYRTASGMFTVDSFVITLLIDFGVVGFILFTLMVLVPAIQMAIFSLKKRGDELDLVLSLAGSLAVYVNVRLVLSQDDNSAIIYMLLGMTTALAARIKATDVGAAGLMTGRSPARPAA